MIDLVEDVIESFPLVDETPSTIIADNKGLAVGAIAPNVNSFQGASFGVRLDDDGSIGMAEPSASASSEAPASISLPSTILMELGIDPSSVPDFRVGFAVYQDDSFFQPRLRKEQPTDTTSEPQSAIGSSIISAQILGIERKVMNIQNPIMVKLPVKQV